MSRHKSKRFCPGSPFKQHLWIHLHGNTVQCKFCPHIKVLRRSAAKWKLGKIKARTESVES